MSKRANGSTVSIRIGIVLAAAALAGCSSSPPTRWYELRLDPPAAATAAAPAIDANEVWELSPRVLLPGALDRDTLVVAAGEAQLQPLTGHRWAEPLRDSVPRVLLHDLSLRRGAGRVWAAPAPAGVAVTRRLRVEILALQADAQQGQVRLSARWWLSEVRPAAALVAAPAASAPSPSGAPAADPAPAGRSGPPPPPQAAQADFTVPVAGPSVDALAAAHRLALWELAGRIAR